MSTFLLQEISKKRYLDANLILRQYKLDLISRFMEKKSITPNLTQNFSGKELGNSDSTLKRFRYDIKRKSPHKFPIKGPKRPQVIEKNLCLNLLNLR